MLAQGPNCLTTKHTSRVLVLIATANHHENYSSEMSLNFEFNYASQVNEINNARSADTENDNRNDISDDVNDRNNIGIENDPRNNIDAGIEVEGHVEILIDMTLITKQAMK